MVSCRVTCSAGVDLCLALCVLSRTGHLDGMDLYGFSLIFFPKTVFIT